jgi:hypothetical protein
MELKSTNLQATTCGNFLKYPSLTDCKLDSTASPTKGFVGTASKGEDFRYKQRITVLLSRRRNRSGRVAG